MTDTCPVCNETMRIPAYHPAELFSHAERHKTTPEELWLKAKGETPMLCMCGCNVRTAWVSWWSGYNDFIIGHNAYIHSGAYDKETEERLTQSRGSNWRNKESMWKGRTKDTDVQVAARAEATSKGWKEKIDSGYVVWIKGQTAETHAGVARGAEQLRQMYASGELVPHMKGLTKDTSDVVRRMAEKVSITHRDKGLRKRLDDIKRLKAEEVQQRIESNSTLRVIIESLTSYQSDAVPNILVECTQCNHRFSSSLRKLQYGRCFNCDPSGSKGQQDVANWFRSVGAVITTNDRTQLNGQELDIFVPAHMFAVEFNGLYWHSLLYKSSTYHEQKTQLSRAAGIALFHVFNDEWSERRSIVESMFMHRMNMTATKIGARKCTVVELDVQQRRSFFEANHIDGDTASKVAWGLMFGDRIVAALSLRSPFHKKHAASLEIARFCCVLNTNVNGALGRLTSVASRYAKEIGVNALLSYVDTRLGSTGKAWETAGWSRTGETTPRFWWTNDKQRFNRFRYKADKKRGMTEAQVAEEAGVVKIYGCKNLIFTRMC